MLTGFILVLLFGASVLGLQYASERQKSRLRDLRLLRWIKSDLPEIDE